MSIPRNIISSVCSLCESAVSLRVTQRGLSAAAHSVIQTDSLKGTPHRKHPGLTNLKTLHLPEELQRGALSIILEAEVNRLSERAQNLTNFLWSRKRAAEDTQLRERAIALEKELLEKEKASHNIEGGRGLETRIKKRVLSELRRKTYHWTPLRYDKDLGVVYMAARLAGGYAAVKRALNEIKKRDSSFWPHSLLDFGSGLGTAVWASHALWGESLKEFVCVDSSGAMNSLAELLLKGGSEKNEPLINQVYFRQFLPVSPKVQSDLVVGAFALSELASQKEREDIVLTLWRKTNAYLVLVENGTKEGHQILMEARETVLKKQDKVIHDPRRPSVFAPCTHELPCPKMAKQPVVPCNFLQPYCPLPLPGNPDKQQEKFSYLILSRVEPVSIEVEKNAESDGLDWARLTAPVLRRAKHVHCHMCCSDGDLKHVVVTARRHGRDMYRCARRSDWGDRLPILQTGDDAQTDSADEPV
ncbi:methyltransferase-like protein 17, mitochondrial [Chanos chanos]|uniref:Ribosome assembly protein METTL17, mitochondrial n=1 Tax=Chanos chanos TaxID=29144 RepID=A0A6J2VCA8_CHACN|nr:methyltransferase-like protein 17, mitochondrial [Chanos chanos]